MTELEKNLDEVTNLAIKTGEKIVTIDCPCCGKAFYVLESKASYSKPNPVDTSSMIQLKLGRKCPHCGFTGGYVSNSKKDQEVEKMLVEMEAEQLAQEAADKRAASWSQICGQGVKFND